jgi:signal transduction histidine kinase/CheY-like chemotaxis protein
MLFYIRGPWDRRHAPASDPPDPSHEIPFLLALADDVDGLVARAAAEFGRRVPCQRCFLYLRNPDGTFRRVILADGSTAVVRSDGESFRAGGPSPWERAARFGAMVSEGASLALPLSASAEVLGVVAFESDDAAPWKDPHRVLQAVDFAVHLAPVLLRHRRERERSAARSGDEERLRKTAAAAEETIRAQSEFLSTMSGELRTPLGAIAKTVRLLLETPLNEQQDEYVRTLRANGESALARVDDVLDASRIETGRLDLENDPFDLERCVEEALDAVAGDAAEKGLDLVYFIDRKTPSMITGDAARLRRILSSLSSNAVEFTEKGEVVALVSAKAVYEEDASGDGKWWDVRFSLKDTGAGIPDEAKGSLFDSPGRVAGRSAARRAGGMGSNLSVCRELARMMGGDITVESRPGKGSTFHLTIRAQEAPSAPKRVQGAGGEAEGRRLLILAGNSTSRHVLTLQIESWGAFPRTTASPEAAVELLGRGDAFDALLVDAQTDGLDLDGFLQEVRRLERSEHLPIIVISWAGKGVPRDAGGVRATVTKPVKARVLYDALATAIESCLPAGGPRLPEALAEGFDPGVLELLRGLQTEDEPDVVDSIIRTFLDDTPNRLQDIGNAIEGNDPHTVLRIAEALKITSANLGAQRLADLCDDLLFKARANSLSRAGICLKGLESEFLRLKNGYRAA